MTTTAWQHEQEQALAAIRRRVDRLLDRPAEPNAPRYCRLAVTVRNPSTGKYPTRAECPNTYFVVFVDGAYARDVDGEIPKTLTKRQPFGDPRTTAHNIYEGLDAYVPIYSLLIVSAHKLGQGQRPQWWFQYLETTPCASSSSVVSSSGPSSSGPSSSAPSSGRPSSSAPSGSSGSSGPPSSAPSGSSGSSGPPSSSGEQSSGSGSSGPPPPSSSGEGITIDVVICEPYNECGQKIVFPQRRIHLPPGSWIEEIPPTKVPLDECQCSCPSSSGEDPSSSGDTSSGDDESSSSSSDDSGSGESGSGDESSSSDESGSGEESGSGDESSSSDESGSGEESGSGDESSSSDESGSGESVSGEASGSGDESSSSSE